MYLIILMYFKQRYMNIFCCFQLSKQFGSIFTIYLGTKKVVVLVGYNAVKEALVDYAEVFGERDLTPIIDEHFQGHGA